MDKSLIIGYLASALMFSTFFMHMMIPLRIVAIVTNIMYIIYSLMTGLMPMLLLHALLLPLNTVRLFQMRRLVRSVREAVEGDLNMDWILPYMSPAKFKTGQVLSKKDDPADMVYYIVEGSVRLDELDVSIGSGHLLGEMGAFTPKGRRLNTMHCETEVKAMTITVERIRELYLQNPRLGFSLTQLIVGRLAENQGRLEGAIMCKAARHD